jgi:hypothetical protein
MSEHHEPELAKSVSLDSAFVAVTCAALLYGVSWVMGCSTTPGPGAGGGKKRMESSRGQVVPERNNLAPLSGRKLTLEKMARSAATSQQYSNEEYGVAFDVPKGYLLKEGELPTMDRGLGYLGPIPMRFALPGGVRLVTIEPPQGLHLGTNFVNEFFTVSAHYGAREAVCADFNIPEESRDVAVARTIDGIEFRGFRDHSAASMHQYSGVYLHGYTNGTCYEIGYGVATAGSGSSSSLRNVNEENLLHRLEKILDNVHIYPPDFERNSTTD